ncbi:MAG: glycosyltransferase [Acidithiobacillus caldus]|uniref:glycosyltransferase family protein n=1 Tax=Acidithiobacillus caldus TaxID=33059 RepID=UPI001C079FB8|nr:glycosyltransferase [Acidithiobacillus caldus]MBU2790750.1 glycosyltransferase family 4 protein [Acidithiobacillus caldus]MBU2820161.1 glycosyltransferase family 4 protein [Acidithiobacillus caldus]WMT47428.1 MAG: glycosyltransferase [Acidithiobacillus caldus]
MSVPFVLVHPADDYACGRYRLRYPAEAIARAGIANPLISYDFLPLDQLAGLAPDLIVVQRVLERDQLRYLARLRRELDAYVVMDLDDLLTDIPRENKLGRKFHEDTASRLREACSLVDRLIVSTPFLAQAYGDWAPEVVVCRNALPGNVWTFPKRCYSALNRRPRVGWAGSSGHLGDLKVLYPVVRALADQVDWVFMGDIPGALAKYSAEVHPRVPIDDYPRALYNLELDLAVAPLVDCDYNSAKSHLRLLELGVCGYPVVCSDVEAFSDVPMPGVRLVPNEPDAWIQAIEDCIEHPANLSEWGSELLAFIESHWLLDGRVGEWASAWCLGPDLPALLPCAVR